VNRTAAIDETGKRYGRLLVISRHPESVRRGAVWLCRCDCGTEKAVVGVELRSGNVTSCGCYNREMRNVSGIDNRRERELEKLADMLSAIVPHCAGGLPQALGIVINEARRIGWTSRRHRSSIPPDLIDRVVESISAAHGIEPEKIFGASQRHAITAARFEVYTVLHRLHFSTRLIGKAFNKEFSGVAAAIGRYEAVIDASAEVRARVAWLAGDVKEKKEAA
jgi:hypothetical protein